MDKSNKPPGEPELEGDHGIMMQNFEKHLGDEVTSVPDEKKRLIDAVDGASVDVTVEPTARSLRICKKLNMFDSSIFEGKTPLILGAAENAPIRSLQLLLDRGASPHVACTQGRTTALMHAACSNYSEVVKLLLSHDFNPDARDNDGWTALLLAANSKQGSNNGLAVRTVQQLLDSGFDPRAVGFDGSTAIHIAAFQGNTELMNILLEHGLDVDVRSHDGSTALMRAAMAGHLAAVRKLIQAKADVNAADGDGRTAMMWAMSRVCHVGVLNHLLGRGADLHIQLLTDGDTLLHDAARMGNLKGVRFLLDNQLNIESRNKLGKTPLMRAISANQVEVVKLLLDRGSDVNARGELVKVSDFTVSTSPLTEAIEIGNLDILQQLLAKGATIGVPEHEEETALLFALSRGRREQDKVVSLFLDRGANANYNDSKTKTTLLLLAIRHNRFGCTNLLLERGADVDYEERNGFTALLYAARWGDAQIAETLLSHGANIEHQDTNGFTALVLSATKGHLAVVRLLLDRGANIGHQTIKLGVTALIMSTMNGHIEVVKVLLDHGAEVGQQDEQSETPLTMAASRGCAEVTRMLLDRGSDPDHRNAADMSALAISTQKGHLSVVKILLEHGADVNITTANWNTPLIIASRFGYEQIAEVLLKRGPNIEACDDEGDPALLVAAARGHTEITKLLLDYGAQLSSVSPSKNNRSTLALASLGGHESVVRLVLERQAQIEVYDDNRDSSLTLAALNGHEGVVKILLEAGANVNTATQRADGAVTPLQIASSRGHHGVVQSLLEGGANPEAPDGKGLTALILAVQNGHVKTVKALVEGGASIEARNQYGNTGLHLASLSGYAEAAKVLLEAGARTDTLDQRGRTALHWASFYGHAGAVKALIEGGARTDTLDQRGFTALHWASFYGHAGAAKVLLEAGARTDTLDQRGKTALHWASLKGHAEAVKALIEGGANIEAPLHDGSTALVRAVADKKEAVVKVLVEGGASTQVRDPRTNTPLIIAITKDSEASFEVLVQAGADINASGEGHMSALSYAALEGRTRMTKMLLEAGAKVEGCPGEVGSPLIWAVRKGFLPTVQALLEGGANAGIEAHDHDGHTALTCAIERNSADLIRALLKAGANIEGRHKNGRTPLLIAAADGHPVAVKTLLEAEADVDASDPIKGLTALMWALRMRHKEVVEIMLEKAQETSHLEVGAADEPVLAWIFNRFESLMAKFLSTASKSRTEIEVMRRRLANSEKPSRRTIASYMRCVDHQVISKEDELSSCELPGCFQLWKKMLGFLTDLLSRQGVLGEVLELWQSVESLINGATQHIVAVGYQGQLKEDYRLSQSEAAGLQNQMIELIDMIREEALVFFESPPENMSLRSSPLIQSSESSSTPKTPEKYPSRKDLGNNLDLSSVAPPAPKRGDAWEKFAFWPPWSNSRSGAHYLPKMLALVASGACDMASISPIWREDTDGLENLKRLVGVARERCVVALCQAWHQDAETFKFVEDWVQPDDGGGITMMPASLAAFEGAVLSGMQKILCIPSAVSKPEAADLVPPPPPPKMCQMIQSQYITTINVVLGGMAENAEMSATSVDEDDEDSDVESDTAASGPASGQAPKAESGGAASACDQNTHMLLTIGNIKHLQTKVLPSLNDQLENVISTKFAEGRNQLSDVLQNIGARIFQSYTRLMVQKLAEAISTGVTLPNWMPAPGRKPRNASPFTYHVLREIVVVKKDVLATASASLATHVVSVLLETVCAEMIKALGSYTSLNLEGLMQATIDSEFLYQVLSHYTTPRASDLQSREYKMLDGLIDNKIRGALAMEMPEMRSVLKRRRRACMGEFSCLRKPKKNYFKHD
ncbi:hypothetical protein PFICI_04416 [Pestalotiopsis fici W106-1]|uniref:Exocyst complex component EXOC2/Sec5 N-terminal domain-containing protein n=1 Tax=Pestalotiopsis fici (strain W106-1 / CGMCC3.15140) TaxID=1229662 RepID=W3X919_PESFW|nr:uncharacterized protein PFICI_04416 [Pestalotiopsis fici W106-1]ETS82540.1 hypothetical protein PFICI_04416 [Pestalotiopsis fici W106-1]